MEQAYQSRQINPVLSSVRKFPICLRCHRLLGQDSRALLAFLQTVPSVPGTASPSPHPTVHSLRPLSLEDLDDLAAEDGQKLEAVATTTGAYG